jgi:hypothetical protein
MRWRGRGSGCERAFRGGGRSGGGTCGLLALAPFFGSPLFGVGGGTRRRDLGGARCGLGGFRRDGGLTFDALGFGGLARCCFGGSHLGGGVSSGLYIGRLATTAYRGGCVSGSLGHDGHRLGDGNLAGRATTATRWRSGGRLLLGASALFALPPGANSRDLLIGERAQMTPDVDVHLTKQAHHLVGGDPELAGHIMYAKLAQTASCGAPAEPDSTSSRIPFASCRSTMPTTAVEFRPTAPPSSSALGTSMNLTRLAFSSGTILSRLFFDALAATTANATLFFFTASLTRSTPTTAPRERAPRPSSRSNRA